MKTRASQLLLLLCLFLFAACSGDSERGSLQIDVFLTDISFDDSVKIDDENEDPEDDIDLFGVPVPFTEVSALGQTSTSNAFGELTLFVDGAAHDGGEVLFTVRDEFGEFDVVVENVSADPDGVASVFLQRDVVDGQAEWFASVSFEILIPGATGIGIFQDPTGFEQDAAEAAAAAAIAAEEAAAAAEAGVTTETGTDGVDDGDVQVP